jgi:hypothetical protein
MWGKKLGVALALLVAACSQGSQTPAADLAVDLSSPATGDMAGNCGGLAGKGCGMGQFCDLIGGACQGADLPGTCVNVPQGCDKNLAPVCGCNGMTYGNDCMRQMAQAQLNHTGPCP